MYMFLYTYIYLHISPWNIPLVFNIRFRNQNGWALLSRNHRIWREVSQSAADWVQRCRGPWQCGTVRYSALQCVAVCRSVLQCDPEQRESVFSNTKAPSSVLHCVALCCSVLQCVVVCCNVSCSVLQCVAVCCSAARTSATDRVQRRRGP